MGRLRKQRGETTVPVEAFSDIAFLLIIFFILVTTFQKQVGFLSEIPSGEKSAQQDQAPEKTPTVKLTDSRISFNDSFVSLESLQQQLTELDFASKEPPERIVLLEAGNGVPYQNYFATMAAIDAAGGVVAIIREE